MLKGLSKQIAIYIISFSLILNSLGCTTLGKAFNKKKVHNPDLTQESCSQLHEIALKGEAVLRLSYLNVLFNKGCFQETISLGNQVRKTNRDKYYNLKNELAEAIVYEGYLKDYTLEAYERVYLGLLIVLSYSRLKQNHNALVELRRTNDEMNAQIYTYGEDEINLLLMGILWEKFGVREDAQPFYRKIVENQSYSELARNFASTRMNGEKHKIETMRVYGMGVYPSIDYSLFSKNDESYRPVTSVKNCVSDHMTILNTRSWIEQVNARDQNVRDPLLKYKRAARLPATILYTSLVFAITGGLTYFAAQAGSGELTTLLGAISIFLTYSTLKDGLAPDMRYWENLPQAFIFTNQRYDWKSDPCLIQYPENETHFRQLL